MDYKELEIPKRLPTLVGWGLFRVDGVPDASSNFIGIDNEDGHKLNLKLVHRVQTRRASRRSVVPCDSVAALIS